MHSDRTLLNDLRHRFKYGGMTTRLIFINLAVYLLIQVVVVISRLFSSNEGLELLYLFFTLNTDIVSFLTHPWGLITSIFSHFSFWHLMMNMLFLYFSGQLFESLFSNKRLWHTYLIGGIAGCLLELLAHQVFPVMQDQYSVIVGASGSIMAIFSALAFYRPNLQVRLFGVFPIRIIFLAFFFILTDFVSLGIEDGVAHFAHLGGILVGSLSVHNIYGKNNLMNVTDRMGKFLNQIFLRLFGSKNIRLQKVKNTRSNHFKTDEEYNLEKKVKSEKTDAILDKIAKSGYESLTKAEKDFLFNQSKNG